MGCTTSATTTEVSGAKPRSKAEDANGAWATGTGEGNGPAVETSQSADQAPEDNPASAGLLPDDAASPPASNHCLALLEKAEPGETPTQEAPTAEASEAPTSEETLQEAPAPEEGN